MTIVLTCVDWYNDRDLTEHHDDNTGTRLGVHPIDMPTHYYYTRPHFGARSLV